MKRIVLIIGGGPAGLTAALRLSEQGYAVTLLEQAVTVGGRWIDTCWGPSGTDPIPPVFIGCQQAILSLLTTLGTAHHVQFSDRLSLEFCLPGRRPIRLRRSLAPAPFHTLLSIAGFRGAAFRDRWRFLNWLERTWEKDPALPVDLETHTGEAWLRGIGQSEAARRHVWNPLSRFLLGDDLRTISAAALLTMLKRCFLSSRPHSRLAIPVRSLRHLFVKPAEEKLIRSGVSIRIETAASQIRFDSHRVIGVRTRTGDLLTADWYIAAIPHRALTPLLPERVLTRFSFFQEICRLTDSSALTIHFRLNRMCPVPRVLLLSGRTFHWIVIRPDESGDQQTVVSLVMTGAPEWLDRPESELLHLALDELKSCVPIEHTIAVEHYRIIRAPQAFLSVRPGTAGLRPLQQSPFPNFLLAGDWTDTGLPATLESAVQSGDLCAQAITAKDAEDRPLTRQA